MEITEVRIKPVKSEGRLLAFASITIDDCFAIHNLKVIGGREGLFVAMPSRRLADGSYKDIAHPVNNDTRKEIEDRVLKEYQDALKGGGVPLVKPAAQEAPASRGQDRQEAKVATNGEAEETLNDREDDSFWDTL